MKLSILLTFVIYISVNSLNLSDLVNTDRSKSVISAKLRSSLADYSSNKGFMNYSHVMNNMMSRKRGKRALLALAKPVAGVVVSTGGGLAVESAYNRLFKKNKGSKVATTTKSAKIFHGPGSVIVGDIASNNGQRNSNNNNNNIVAGRDLVATPVSDYYSHLLRLDYTDTIKSAPQNNNAVWAALTNFCLRKVFFFSNGSMDSNICLLEAQHAFDAWKLHMSQAPPPFKPRTDASSPVVLTLASSTAPLTTRSTTRVQEVSSSAPEVVNVGSLPPHTSTTTVASFINDLFDHYESSESQEENEIHTREEELDDEIIVTTGPTTALVPYTPRPNLRPTASRKTMSHLQKMLLNLANAKIVDGELTVDYTPLSNLPQTTECKHIDMFIERLIDFLNHNMAYVKYDPDVTSLTRKLEQLSHTRDMMLMLSRNDASKDTKQRQTKLNITKLLDFDIESFVILMEHTIIPDKLPILYRHFPPSMVNMAMYNMLLMTSDCARLYLNDYVKDAERIEIVDTGDLVRYVSKLPEYLRFLIYFLLFVIGTVVIALSKKHIGHSNIFHQIMSRIPLGNNSHRRNTLLKPDDGFQEMRVMASAPSHGVYPPLTSPVEQALSRRLIV